MILRILLKAFVESQYGYYALLERPILKYLNHIYKKALRIV